MTQSGNFSFLAEHSSLFAQLGRSAEQVFSGDPNIPLCPALEQEITRQKISVLSSLEVRNFATFEQETEKLDAWADDLKVGLEGEIKDIDRRIKDARTLGKATVTLAEKLTLQKEQRDLEAKRHRKRRDLFNRQDEIQLRRDNLIDELETQLKQSVNVVHIFALEWTVL